MQATRFLTATAALGLAILFPTADAQAHELWFHAPDGGSIGEGPTRLYFADDPEPGEAERVAEIAHARVWADGEPLEVRRLDDGLEVRLPTPAPDVASAYADRGVIDYEGKTFVIELAAYAQAGPIDASATPELGVNPEQLRLLLVQDGDGPPVVRACRAGAPVAGLTVRVFAGGLAEGPTESVTDSRGEIPCPDRSNGPVALDAQVIEPTPGRRNDRDYTEVRYKATLTLGKGQ